MAVQITNRLKAVVHCGNVNALFAARAVQGLLADE